MRSAHALHAREHQPSENGSALTYPDRISVHARRATPSTIRSVDIGVTFANIWSTNNAIASLGGDAAAQQSADAARQ